MLSAGRNGTFVSPSEPMRVIAVSISSNGFAVDTDQSLPKAMTAPLFSMLAIGYI